MSNRLRGAVIAALVVGTLSILSLPGRADTAEATYKAKCALCHGAEGKGDTPTGKAMKTKDFSADDVKKMTDDQLASSINNGKPPMPGFKSSLSADQVKGLVAYIRTLQKGK